MFDFYLGLYKAQLQFRGPMFVQVYLLAVSRFRAVDCHRHHDADGFHVSFFVLALLLLVLVQQLLLSSHTATRTPLFPSTPGQFRWTPPASSMDNNAGADDPGQLLPQQLHARRRFGAAAYFAAWGVAGLLSTILPDLAANRDHVMLYFVFLMVGVLLVLLGVAAQDLLVADRAANLLEGWIRTLFYNEPRA